MLGVQIAVDEIDLAFATVGGEELWAETVPLDLRNLDAAEGYRRVAEVLTEQIQRLGSDRALISVEVGVPGYVSRERGSVCNSRALGWQDVPLRAWLESTLWEAGVTHPVHVGVANDCQFAALYAGRVELRLQSDLVAVYYGGLRELGSGVLIDGDIFGGAHGGAGDLGHANVASSGGVCWCGRNDCLQMAISPVALLTSGALLPQTGAEEMVDQRPIDALSLISDAAAAGDQRVLDTLASAGDTLGAVLDHILGSLNPHAAILGGYVGLLSPYLMPSLEARLASRLANPAYASTRVVALGATTTRRVVSGAVVAARDEVLAEPLLFTWMVA